MRYNPPSNGTANWDQCGPMSAAALKRRDSVESSALLAAAERLEGLAERWEETEVWHEPPFLEGAIKITTGDLKDIATIVRGIQAANVKSHSLDTGSAATGAEYGIESEKSIDSGRVSS